jgi:hypothetical protein
MILTIENIFDFCRTYDWLKRLEDFENTILPERWSYLEPRTDVKNTKNPILENYIKHTFIRLYHVCKDNQENEKKYLYTKDDMLCFNTGLFTKQYEKTFFLLKYEEKQGDTKVWGFEGFVKESDYRLADFDYLPKKVGFFEKIDDLIYDTSFDLRINSAHILADSANLERIPAEIRAAKNLQILFDGALEQVKKKIEANYKVAVPQYFEGNVQLLLPLSLRDPEVVDLVLVVARKNNSYAGRTCLTLDMAYNNARLIAKPETPWLARN